MSDKIMKFEDYKNKAVTPEPVSQDTMNIQIEDPYQFLSAEEREEYILQRQKEQSGEAPKEREVRQEHEERREVREPREAREVREPREDREPREAREHREPAPRRRRPEEDYQPDYDEEYDGDEEYYEEEDDSGDDAGMQLVVRIASILTGIVILAFIAMALKIKVYDRYFAPDPDEAPVTVAAPAIPSGFIEKNDTVVVTGASTLNIRSVPSAESKETVVGMVPEGDELKRIAVSEDGSWALVEVDGQQVYASMKYLKEK